MHAELRRVLSSCEMSQERACMYWGRSDLVDPIPPLFPPFVLYRIAGVSGHGGTRGGARRAPTHTSAFYANATVTTLL